MTVDGKIRHLRGWVPDRPDHRDIKYSPVLKSSFLPKKIDLRDTGYLPRVEDQGQIGSCTMNAATSALEFLYRKAGKPQPELSRLFGYYAERVRIALKNPEDDSGAQNREAMKSLVRYGVCLESTWPYDVSKFAENPPEHAWKEALNYRIIKYHRVTGLRGIKTCLVEGFPVVIGFGVPETIDEEYTSRTGIIKYPGNGVDMVGGHAVLIVGYNDADSLLIFKNSWGTGWGDKGFGYLPYRFFSSGLASDFWTIRTSDEVK